MVQRSYRGNEGRTANRVLGGEVRRLQRLAAGGSPKKTIQRKLEAILRRELEDRRERILLLAGLERLVRRLKLPTAPHSYRSAINGSTRAARRAGR